MNPAYHREFPGKRKAAHRLLSILLISLLTLSVFSGSALTSVTNVSDGDLESIPVVAGTRQGGNISVLLINGSDESAPIFRQIIAGNDTYDLTEEAQATTDPSGWATYDILVWSQGRKDANASLESELQEYVLDGGHLLIEGANIAEHAGSTEFEDEVIHASSIDVADFNNYVGQNLSKLEPTHPVASQPHNLASPIEFISDGTSRLDSDVCDVENGSVMVLEWDQITQVNGTTADNSNEYGGVIAFDDDSNLSNDGQVVFFSFGLSLVNGTDNRTELVENAMDWLIPIEIEEYYAFYLTPDHQDQNTNSGGSAVYDIRVVNNGTLDDTYDLFREAPPAGWTATLNQTSVDVEAGKNTSFSLTVTAPVSAQNGDYANISVWGNSQGDGTLTYLVYTNTTVNNEARADLEPITLGPTGGEMVLGPETIIRSLVRNNGDRDANNVIVTFYLDDNPSFPIGNDTIDVPAGDETIAEILWNATNFFSDHLIIVEVDSGQNHPESNESNNELENATRDWVVRDHVEWIDAVSNVTGNLTLEGTLLLDNVTLELNSTEGEFGFYVSSTGNLNAVDSEFGPIGNGDDDTIRFQTRGDMLLVASTIRGLYYNGNIGDPHGGVEIFSSTCEIINSTITDSDLGVWTSVSPMLQNVTFTNITTFGLFSIAGSPTIDISNFSGMTTAVTFKGGGGTIMGSEIFDVSTGIYLDQGSGAIISDNSIHDLDGLKRGIFVLESSPIIIMNEIHRTNTAVWIEGEDSSPLIYRNDLSGNDAYSVYSEDATTILESNVISGNGIYGVRLEKGDVTIRNLTIEDNKVRAIHSYRATLTVENVTIAGNDDSSYDEGIFSYDSDITLLKTTFDSWTIDLDMNLTHSTILTVVNTTYESVNRTGGSIISTGWFITVKAEDRSYYPIPNATVTIRNVNGDIVYQGITDESGHVSDVKIITHNETDDGTEWFTPHRIDIDSKGGNGNLTERNLSLKQTFDITVNEPPIAVIGVKEEKGSSETEFRFHGTGSSDDSFSIASYYFDFGDGENSGWLSRDDTFHTFQYAGIYTVTLIVKDYDGAVSEPSTIEITINNPPKVNLPEEIIGKEGVQISFEADVFDPDSWDNLHYEWDFGDGETSNLINPLHAYEEMGDYEVRLTVNDDHGDWGDDLMDVEIVRNREPEADAGKDMNVTFNNGAQVQFTSDSFDPDGDTLTYEWDFEDGSASQQEHPNHFYKDPGTYNVTFTVTDDSGANDTDIVTVNVIYYRITFPFEPHFQGHREELIRPSVTIQNNGSHPILINLTAEGSWLTILLANITLEPEEQRTLFVRIQIPANAQMDISEQTFLAESGGEEFRASIFVDVQEQPGVVLSIQAPTSVSANAGDEVSYTLKLKNTGSDKDSFRIQVSSFPPGWIVLLNDAASALLDRISPGSDVFITVKITIPEGESGGQKTVTIIASSVSDPSIDDTVDLRTTVVEQADPDPNDESNIGLYAGIGIIVLFLILGYMFMSRRDQDMRYAEDEYADDEGFGDWDDGPEERKQKPKDAPPKVKPRILKCPKCATLLEVPSAKRPITIECPGCGARAHIKK